MVNAQDKSISPHGTAGGEAQYRRLLKGEGREAVSKKCQDLLCRERVLGVTAGGFNFYFPASQGDLALL